MREGVTGSLRRRAFDAVHTIVNETFPRESRVWKYINVDECSVSFEEILMGPCFSPTEDLLLRIGASLWVDDGYPTSVGEIANRLDDGQLATVLRALCTARGGALPNLPSSSCWSAVSSPALTVPPATGSGLLEFSWDDQPLSALMLDDPSWVPLIRHDRAYAAVRLIGMEAFPHDTHVWWHIDDSERTASFADILGYHEFTERERLLLRIAASIWLGWGWPTDLAAVARLDDASLSTVLRALAAARGGNLPSPT